MIASSRFQVDMCADSLIEVCGERQIMACINNTKKLKDINVETVPAGTKYWTCRQAEFRRGNKNGWYSSYSFNMILKFTCTHHALGFPLGQAETDHNLARLDKHLLLWKQVVPKKLNQTCCFGIIKAKGFYGAKGELESPVSVGTNKLNELQIAPLMEE